LSKNGGILASAFSSRPAGSFAFQPPQKILLFPMVSPPFQKTGGKVPPLQMADIAIGQGFYLAGICGNRTHPGGF